MGNLPSLIAGLSTLARFKPNRNAATDRKATGNGQWRSLTSRQVGAEYFRIDSGTQTKFCNKPQTDCFSKYGTKRDKERDEQPVLLNRRPIHIRPI
jgi:hypothetical protein